MLSHGQLGSEVEGANRFVSYMKSIGVRAALASGSVQVRVPESVWKEFLAQRPVEVAVDSQLVAEVESIKAKIIAFCENPDVSLSSQMEAQLEILDSLPIDIEVLKRTKIGVEINKLSKHIDRAKLSLTKLKEVYLESKK